ncbi:MAG TPA: two-component regulator propeller domain-containing protein, partial [Saprospiraceae bacterium]|nr:two-component regulator propeller domain-containing protein [Saprospiraceae bacterium]
MFPLHQILRLFLAIELLGRAVVFLSAQTPSSLANFNPRFELFKLPGGEAANNVDCIVQDAVGFVWFGSQAGLHRYDGQRIITFHHNPLDSNSIASDQVTWICIDSKGTLWLGHWGQGVSVFDPVTEKCAHYVYDPNNPDNPKNLSGNIVPMIVEDRKGYIWIATSGGLDRFDRQIKQFEHFRHQPGDTESLSYDFVNALFVDKGDTLWVGCGSPFDAEDVYGNKGGLNRYNGDGTFTRYLNIPKDTNSLGDNRVRTIFEDSRGNFWVGTAGIGLHRMDRQTGKFTRLPFDPAHPSRLGSPVLQRSVSFIPDNFQIAFVREDQKGRLWIGAMEGGLNIYDPSTGVMRHFEEAKGMTDSLQAKSVWQFCQTRDGVVWLSCGSGGWAVYRVKNEGDLFHFYDARALGTERITITGVLKDQAGYVWLQTLGDFTGILRLDPADRRKWKRFHYDPPVVNGSFLDFFELGTDPQGNIWASTDKGLYKMNLNEADSKTARFRPDTTLTPSIAQGSPWPPFYDTHSNIWVATWGGGLYRFDSGTKKPTHFLHDPADPQSIGGNQVEKVFRDNEGNIWVQGGSIAIDAEHPLFFDRFEPDPNGGPGSFKHFLPPGEMGDPAKSLEDKNGNFWFTAYPYGVRKLHPNTGEYRSFTVANGAWPTNGISDIVRGNDGNIWMLGKDVIIALDPETEISFNYTPYHGVQTAAFSFVTGSCLAPDGEIFFGGEGGFHAFFPEEIHRRANKNPTHLFITDLKINGLRIVPGMSDILSRPIWETGEIQLPHDRNVFSFNVSCFDFNGSELSRLEFRLENYDRDWRSDLREGEASYVNVPPGAYVFRARGANSMGVWGSETALQVVVLPPWWQTWWAYL